MTQPEKVPYTAKTHTTGGRNGASSSFGGHPDIKLSTPGSACIGTNPEQFFAAGWLVYFEGAMGIAARKKITLPADLSIDAEVDLCITGGYYFLQARLNVSLPGVDREVAQALVNEAHQTCLYHRAHFPLEKNNVRRNQPTSPPLSEHRGHDPCCRGARHDRLRRRPVK